MSINSFEIKISKLANNLYQYKLIINQFNSICLLYLKDLNHVSLIFNNYDRAISEISLEIFIQSTFKFVSDIISFEQYKNLVFNFYHNTCSSLLLEQL